MQERFVCATNRRRLLLLATACPGIEWGKAPIDLGTSFESESNLRSTGVGATNHKSEERMNNDSRVAGAREDNVTGMIESQTSQIPSSAYLGAAIGSMAVAAILKMAGKHQGALFVGQWAAPFLLMGVYNKMVKQHGSDAESRRTAEAA